MSELERHVDHCDDGNLLLFALLGLEAHGRVLDRLVAAACAEPPAEQAVVGGEWLDGLLGVVAVRRNLARVVAGAVCEAGALPEEPSRAASWTRELLR